MKELKGLYASVLPEAPMRVIAFSDFECFRMIPRSSDTRKTQKGGSKESDHEGKLLHLHDVNEVSRDMKLIFISHRWLRPDVDPAKAHPDDAQGSKHKLICAGVRKLGVKKGWNINQVGLWLDFCGVEQDDDVLLKAGVASLRGYISICDAVLIPSPDVPEAGDNTVDKIAGEYGARAWTRLESMSFYVVNLARLCIHVCVYKTKNVTPNCKHIFLHLMMKAYEKREESLKAHDR